ncbi:MAG: hypothetical protein ACXU82_07095 [Caulobacteraceae bacterium]
MEISDNELAALQNLADKHAGRDVGWINISDARALTELGLARRNGAGWVITPEGLSLVSGGPVEVPSSAPTPMVGRSLRLAPEPSPEND